MNYDRKEVIMLNFFISGIDYIFEHYASSIAIILAVVYLYLRFFRKESVTYEEKTSIKKQSKKAL